MGRKRQKNKNLPPRVYVHHGSYRYVPKTGKRITLAKVGDYGGMLRALADVVADNPPLTTLTDRLSHDSAGGRFRLYFRPMADKLSRTLSVLAIMISLGSLWMAYTTNKRSVVLDVLSTQREVYMLHTTCAGIYYSVISATPGVPLERLEYLLDKAARPGDRAMDVLEQMKQSRTDLEYRAALEVDKAAAEACVERARRELAYVMDKRDRPKDTRGDDSEPSPEA